MNTIDAVHALEGIVAALALGVMAYGPWQWVSVDLARQRMFASRDKLFDMAVAGKLEFGSPEYEGVRESFNHMIRFAHSLTWLRFLFILTVGKPMQKKEGAAPVRVLVAGIRDQETRRAVRRLQREVERAAMLLMIMRAPVLVLASILLIIPALLVAAAFIWARDVLKGWADDIGDLLEIEARIFEQ